ncbi:hypothetical protein AVEN_52180-1 [Araneus ventricosus]|uniref:Uncharacterized protein n=1 Tax=Araneus ventricosus TaxID=182803 RepID=A0A4Y2T1R7_ARAVE|nr:hypothetical protein AVEN_52180-1 [Araneus ventricosus]
MPARTLHATIAVTFTRCALERVPIEPLPDGGEGGFEISGEPLTFPSDVSSVTLATSSPLSAVGTGAPLHPLPGYREFSGGRPLLGHCIHRDLLTKSKN